VVYDDWTRELEDHISDIPADHGCPGWIELFPFEMVGTR